MTYSVLSLCELRKKEIINTSTGCRLGCVCDLELDCSCGRVCAIIASGHQSLFSLKRPESYRIPWSCISKIGDDIILVSSAEAICKCSCNE
ncbi:MAG: YlmC/YmxH family sporulation protein [Clostridia bacterium]|nr:YlmC/YmxH family sporulation protein [Clostridia bacterium]